MTSWSYAINKLYGTGAILLYEESWWIALCGWIINNVIGYGCHLLHWIKFPNWIKIDRNGYTYGLGEYYGDLGQLYHILIFDPLFQWHIRHRKEIWVEVGYDRVKELFGASNPKFFADHEAIPDAPNSPL